MARLEKLLEQEVQRLSPQGLHHVERLLDELQQANGAPLPLHRALLQADYEMEPASLEKFVFDAFYLGGSLKGKLYPAVLDDLIEIFEGDYLEICLGGGIGWGKTWEIAIGIAYDVYQLSCLRNPAEAYGLIPGSTLAFLNASVNKAQAQKVLFRDLSRLLQNSPYFHTFFPYDPNVQTEIRFLQKNILCYPVAANEQALLGESVFSAAFDELNFMSTIEKSRRTVPGDSGLYDQAQVITDKLSARIRSRFNDRGKLPGHLWFSSSARYPNDFTERKEAEAMREAAEGKLPTIFVRHRALWEAKPRSFFMTKTFKVEVGDITRRTRVLTCEETDISGRVIEVPMDFYESFTADPEKCVRDLAGISVLSITPFIARREAIAAMFGNGKALGMLPTFGDAQGNPKLEVTLQSPLPESERLLPQYLHWIERQKQGASGQPLFLDPQHTQPAMERVLFPALYYAHIDLSKTSCATGIVVGHAQGGIQVPRFDEQSGKTIVESKPVIRIDLALRVVAPPNGEIDIPKVRSLIYRLGNLGPAYGNQGMQFGLVTFDTFGSQESVKSLKDAGYSSDVYSLEKDLTPWEEMKQALYDGRLLCYEFPHLEKELAQLELVKGKIEKPAHAGASKDVADCLAAVVHHVEEGWRKAEGSRGLFQLGEVEGQSSGPDPLRERATTKMAQGETLTDEELDKLLFGDLDKL